MALTALAPLLLLAPASTATASASPGLAAGATIAVGLLEGDRPAETATTTSFGRLLGRLETRGTRRPIPFADLVASSSTGLVRAELSGPDGRFRLDLPPGAYTLEVRAGGHRRFLQEERVVEGRALEVVYLLDPERADPYEVVVRSTRRRTEVANTVLRGKELTQVAGTFGDPFRVISTLPGVAPVMSLLPFPVVRGSSPGNTGFLLDGAPVPLLFHLLAGPSVIHPRFLEELAFWPGGFSVDYGGYTAGIVDGRTKTATSTEEHADLDLNLFQIGGYGASPVLGGTGAIAGRYGFPGFILGLADPRTSLDYWDYQLRLDLGGKRSGFSAFLFGAYDELRMVPPGQPEDAEKQPLVRFQFHRLDLAHRYRAGPVTGSSRVTFALNESLAQDDATLRSLSVTPRLRLEATLAESVVLGVGLDGGLRRSEFVTGEEGAGVAEDLLGPSNEPPDWLLSGGGLAELFLRPGAGLLLRPGVRVDVFSDTRVHQVGFDPRLLARLELPDAPADLALKASVGMYHQPPRFTIPLPGLDELAFSQGLLESIQTSVGAELGLLGFTLDVQGYFAWMDPILYDVQINPNPTSIGQDDPSGAPGEIPDELPVDDDGFDDRLDQLLRRGVGRAYGVELLVRRESQTGPSGWISYTFSRAERRRDGEWVAFDFDRTHILNLVLGVPLPRSWQLGFRAQVVGGRPLTTTAGLATARAAPFVRFDLRVDKTAIWNDWLLDFYVDVSNVLLGAEELAPANVVRYVLPTLGFRAMF